MDPAISRSDVCNLPPVAHDPPYNALKRAVAVHGGADPLHGITQRKYGEYTVRLMVEGRVGYFGTYASLSVAQGVRDEVVVRRAMLRSQAKAARRVVASQPPAAQPGSASGERDMRDMRGIRKFTRGTFRVNVSVGGKPGMGGAHATYEAALKSRDALWEEQQRVMDKRKTATKRRRDDSRGDKGGAVKSKRENEEDLLATGRVPSARPLFEPFPL